MDDEAAVRMVGIDAAAKYLGVSVNTVRKFVGKEEITHARIAGKLLFTREDLDEFIDNHTVEAA